jgi:hypothetical protein
MPSVTDTMVMPRLVNSFVYLLLDDKGYPFYVGSSNNVYGRIGKWVAYWGTTTLHEVEVVRCTDREHMLEVEKSLIKYYEPTMNTMHIPWIETSCLRDPIAALADPTHLSVRSLPGRSDAD